MLKYEEKFIVFNTKFFKLLDYGDTNSVNHALGVLRARIPKEKQKNKYYVCNQDEPYAQKVIDIILKGDKDTRQNTKVKIVKLISELEDTVANNEDCHKIVTKLKYAANKI